MNNHTNRKVQLIKGRNKERLVYSMLIELGMKLHVDRIIQFIKAINKDEKKFPIFLLGSARSGTTLLQKIFNSRDDVAMWGEHGGFLKGVADAYFLNLTDKDTKEQILGINYFVKKPREILDRLHHPKKLGYAWINCYSEKTLKKNFRTFVESFFRPKFLKRKVHWGFKEIRYSNGSVIAMLDDLYPEAKFVFIVRDPLDVVASQLMMGWKGEPKERAKKWAIRNKHLLNFHNNNKDKSFIIRYEDLIRKESGALKELFDWLGWEITTKQYDVIGIKEGIWKKERTDGKPHRAMFTKEQIEQISKKTKEVSEQLGY